MNPVRVLRSFVVTVVAFVVLAAPAVVLADGRVALVVGNSTYAHIGRLPNADNDAADMSAALRRLGFEVTTELDADRAELTEALFGPQTSGPIWNRQAAAPPSAVSGASPPLRALRGARVAAKINPQGSAETNAERNSATPAPMSNAQLPPEILVDRHLVRAERLLAEDDPGAALEAMNEILALQEEHDLVLEDDFHFQYGRVAFAVGRTETAIASLNEYLVAAGRGGEFYRRALELLDSAEVRLREEERAARWPPGGTFRDCEVCPNMVVLPGGDLALGRYELTVGEYRAFASATGGGAGAGCQALSRVTPDSWQDPGHPQTDRHPVTCLSWDDAQEYVSWLSRETGASYRLPSEAEWGRAAAGSQPGCYVERTGTASTCPVGSYGSNRLGLSDMASNLAEWTSDCWEGDCRSRVLRGGSWVADPQYQSPAGRNAILAHRRSAFFGFRVARALE